MLVVEGCDVGASVALVIAGKVGTVVDDDVVIDGRNIEDDGDEKARV